MRQKGFTLIELMVTLAVSSVIIVGALAATHQVVLGTSRTNSQVVTLTDVHQAALRLKKDLEMAQLDEGDFSMNKACFPSKVYVIPLNVNVL